MTRVLLLTHYYPPELGAAQTRLSETVRGLRRLGMRVSVAAPIPHYPAGVVPTGYLWWRPRRESIEGVPIWRLPVLPRGGDRFLDRIASQASFALTAMSTVHLARRHDVILVESPPLFLAASGRMIARAAGRAYVLHVADPWPDFPIAMGYLRGRTARDLAFRLERFAYEGASAITTVTPGLVELLAAKPGGGEKVVLVPNAVDVDRFAAAPDRATARSLLGWSPEAFTIVYAGTLGAAQGMRTVIDAATLIDGQVSIRLIGDGVERAKMEAYARSRGGGGVSFHAPMARDDVPLALAAADAGLVMLRDGPLYEMSLPTKLVEAMASGRAVIVSAQGTAASMVESVDAGYIAAPGDPAALAAAIRRAMADPDRDRRGERGQALMRADYDRPRVVQRLAAVLEGAAGT